MVPYITLLWHIRRTRESGSGVLNGR